MSAPVLTLETLRVDPTNGNILPSLSHGFPLNLPVSTTVGGVAIGISGAFDVFNVSTYGAVGNGTTDDSTAVQAAITAAQSAGGGIVYLDANKTYKITATLTINSSKVELRGAGKSSKILAVGDFGDIIYIRPTADPTTTPANGLISNAIRDLYIDSSTTRTTGYAVHARYTQDFQMVNVRIGTQEGQYGSLLRIYDGVYLDGQDSAWITRSKIFARHKGVTVVGRSITWGTVSGSVQDLPNFAWNGHIDSTEIWGSSSPKYVAGSIGIHIAGGTGGFQIDGGVGIGYQETGIKVDKTIVNVINRELFLNNSFSADDIGGNGIQIASGSLSILQINNLWTAGCGRSIGGDGLHVDDGSTTSTVIVGGTSYANVGYGIYIGGGSLTLNGVKLHDNGGGPDLNADMGLGAGVTDALIVGNSFLSDTHIVNNSGITPQVYANYNEPFSPALGITSGGSGKTSFTAYAPVFGGTTSTGALQSGTVGTTGQVLKSNGAGALPTFQTLTTGDASTNTATSVDGEMAVFSGTGGKTLKRVSAVTGFPKLVSGVVTLAGGNDIATAIGSNQIENATNLFDLVNGDSLIVAGSADLTFNNFNTITFGAGKAAIFLAALDSGLGLVKPAVAVVAVSNLTLSGEQTIDGQLTSASLVLATAQSTGSQNGPWVSAAGAWARPTWYANASTTQAPQFLTTFVRLGTTYQGSTWRMTTAAVTIGTTSTTWVQTKISLATSNVTGTLPVANGGTGITSFGTNIATALGTSIGGTAFVNGSYAHQFSGATAARTITIPDANFTVARTDAANTFTGHQTIEGVTSTGATGTGKLVFDGTPTLVTPELGAATGTSLTFSQFLKSTTAFATPSALSATQFSGFASTVSGAAIMGYGTTNDVSLMNRAGTVCLGVGPNTTTVNVPGLFKVGDGVVGNNYLSVSNSGATGGLSFFSGDVILYANSAAIIGGSSTGTLTAYASMRFSPDNTLDIGLTASTSRPRDLFLSRNATVGGTLSVTGASTLTGGLIYGVQALSGAGAINLTTVATDYTSTGGSEALTLANGTVGQIKTITHIVDGGSGILTPTTKTGYTTITFTNAGDSVTLRYCTTAGWCVIGSFGVTIA